MQIPCIIIVGTCIFFEHLVSHRERKVAECCFYSNRLPSSIMGRPRSCDEVTEDSGARPGGLCPALQPPAPRDGPTAEHPLQDEHVSGLHSQGELPTRGQLHFCPLPGRAGTVRTCTSCSDCLPTIPLPLPLSGCIIACGRDRSNRALVCDVFPPTTAITSYSVVSIVLDLS